MLRKLIARKLDSEERRMGVPLDYLRYILRVSLRSFLTFARIVPISQHRRSLPPEPYYVARMVATRDADCGTCLQIEVNLARRDGVAPELLRAVVERDTAALPAELAEVYRFTEAVVAASGAEEEIRPALIERWGEKGVVELAIAIAVARFFPVVKRSLGYARSCRLVEIEIAG